MNYRRDHYFEKNNQKKSNYSYCPNDNCCIRNSSIEYKNSIKNFALGNKHSANFTTDSGNITKETVETLSIKYGFDLIPLDEPEVIAAGYTENFVRNNYVAVWYGPTTDDNNFYYVAFSGGILNPLLPSILVCRNIEDGSLVYARDCRQYDLDTSNNFLQTTRGFVRIAPAIYGDTLYLASGFISNIGPQLYAIDKNTGLLKWAIAYDTPNGIPITVKGNYASSHPNFVGSNLKLSDLNIVVEKFPGDTYPTVLCGVSSLQNTPINVGILANGIPIFTDQGALFQIEDRGNAGVIKGKIATCAPLLKEGDFISNSGDDAYNPFFPGLDYTVIGTIAINRIIDPFIFTNDNQYLPVPPSPATNNTTPISAVIKFNKSTPLNPNIFQTAWGSVDGLIYQDFNRITTYTMQELLNAWIIEQNNLPPSSFASITHVIWTYLNQSQLNTILQQTGNSGITYLKTIYTDTNIMNQYDAQGLNYYGNNVWGANPSICGSSIYFGSGQSHSLPFFEAYYYSIPERDFQKSKTALAEAEHAYVDGSISIDELNAVKDEFLIRMRDTSIHGLRSPRGLMSYSDSILSTNHYTNDLIFGARTVPNDFFLFAIDPFAVMVSTLNVIDGDVSAGIQLYDCGKKISAGPKSGLGITLNLSNLNNIPFNHHNLLQKGVIYQVYQYLGPSGILGGSNYGSTQDGCDTLITCQGNLPLVSVDSPLEEIYVSPTGKIIYRERAYISAMNINTGEVKWVSPLIASGYSQVSNGNGIIYSADIVGNLFAHDIKTGVELWQSDNSKSKYPTFGGISSACVLENLIIWTPQYAVPLGPGPGATGLIPVGIALEARPKQTVCHNYYCCCHCNRKNILN